MTDVLLKIRTDCSKCKGDSRKCHPPRCPQRIKAFALNQVKHEFQNKTSLEGFNPPSFFVGSTNYPNITISPMISLDSANSTFIDEPDIWKTNYQIPQIVNFRAHLIRAQGRRVDARQIEQLNNKLLSTSQELVLASNPVYTSLNLEKPLQYGLSFNTYTQPMGPRGRIKSFTVEDTPKIDHKVDYLVSDTDLLANNGINGLYDLGLSVTRINRILSAGNLGLKGKRSLVPTRWAITATDDNIGKHLIQQIKSYPEINDYRVFESNYLDNHFITIMTPNRWSYEFLEAWGDTITGDFENYTGRTNYASNSAGGYYASRLAILEYLVSIKRQAEIYCWRYIGNEYYIPLGVWQVRENVRSSLDKYRSFDDLSSAFLYISSKLQLPLKQWQQTSLLLNFKKRQKSILSYIKG